LEIESNILRNSYQTLHIHDIVSHFPQRFLSAEMTFRVIQGHRKPRFRWLLTFSSNYYVELFSRISCLLIYIYLTSYGLDVYKM